MTTIVIYNRLRILSESYNRYYKQQMLLTSLAIVESLKVTESHYSSLFCKKKNKNKIKLSSLPPYVKIPQFPLFLFQ